MTTNGNDFAANFVETVSWNNFSDDVKQKIKICLFDCLGAIISGHLSAIKPVALRFAEKMWGKDAQSQVYLNRHKLNAAGAAFVNATAANAFDIDDDGKYTEGHPGAQIIPVALAMAEKNNRSGKEALTAMVIGYEIAHRTGRCWHDHHHSYQACGSWGSVANAAVTAKLLGLDTHQIQQAFGIAEYFAPNLPMMRDIDHPAMVKHGIGWGAMTGIMAAELSLEGFTGIPSILGFEKYSEWVGDLGKEYIFLKGVTFKRFASCLWGHPPIPVTTKLIERHHIDITLIEKIVIHSFSEMTRLGTGRPLTEEEAQFNVAWPLAGYLLEGEVGPAQMVKERLKDPIIKDLAGRIELVESTEMNNLYSSESYPCRVQIFTKNRDCFDSGIEYFTNSSVDNKENKFSDMWQPKSVKNKFQWICKDIITRETIDKIMDLVENFDELEEISPLYNLLNQTAVCKKNEPNKAKFTNSTEY